MQSWQVIDSKIESIQNNRDLLIAVNTNNLITACFTRKTIVLISVDTNTTEINFQCYCGVLSIFIT